MNKLKLSTYLAGAMEAESDLGSGWRAKLTPFLEEKDFEVLNPCEFEPEQLKGMHFNRLPDFFTNRKGEKIKPTHWHNLKDATEPHLYNRFLKYMRLIIKYDIKIVNDHTDFVIVHWNDKTGKGAGTHAELTAAFLKNIPVYCVLTSETMPAWARACCTNIFNNFDELKDFINKEM